LARSDDEMGLGLTDDTPAPEGDTDTKPEA
jgi:hypothetical protein